MWVGCWAGGALSVTSCHCSVQPWPVREQLHWPHFRRADEKSCSGAGSRFFSRKISNCNDFCTSLVSDSEPCRILTKFCVSLHWIKAIWRNTGEKKQLWHRSVYSITLFFFCKFGLNSYQDRVQKPMEKKIPQVKEFSSKFLYYESLQKGAVAGAENKQKSTGVNMCTD